VGEAKTPLFFAPHYCSDTALHCTVLHCSVPQCTSMHSTLHSTSLHLCYIVSPRSLHPHFFSLFHMYTSVLTPPSLPLLLHVTHTHIYIYTHTHIQCAQQLQPVERDLVASLLLEVTHILHIHCAHTTHTLHTPLHTPLTHHVPILSSSSSGFTLPPAGVGTAVPPSQRTTLLLHYHHTLLSRTPLTPPQLHTITITEHLPHTIPTTPQHHHKFWRDRSFSSVSQGARRGGASQA
jgi:hypothetical protein